MKPYPSISRNHKNGERVHIFAKYDGSLCRAEWTKKKGFVKFGRRNGLLDDSNPVLKEFPDIFIKKYGDDLDKIFREQRYESATCFSEFFGPNSFAGNHQDEAHDVVLFDVSVYKKGFLAPKEFLKLLGHLKVQELLFEGNFNSEIAEQIVNGTLPGITFEGVICKGAIDKKTGLPLAFKMKQKCWIEKLKGFCGDNQQKFDDLL